MGNNNKPFSGLFGSDDNTFAASPTAATPDFMPDPSSFAPSAGHHGASDNVGITFLDAPNGGGSAAKAGSSGSASGSTTTTTTTSSTSPFVINITWDSSVASAPSAFKSGILAAVAYLESTFTDAVTINISVGYGEVMGSSLGSNALGSSISYLSGYSYSALRNALASDATSTTDVSAVASLAATAPVSGNFWTTTAEAKALGLASANGTSTDGYIGFSSSLPFTYSDTNGVASGTYDFFGTALHELTEVMGRQTLNGGTIGSYANSYSVMDLFHYASSGVRDFSATTPGYLSADGGKTSIAALNTVSGGDGGDWASSMGNNALDAFSNAGVVNSFSAADVTAMDLLGWNVAGSTTSTPTPTTTPQTISLAAVTTSLNAGQVSNGILSGTALAAISVSGGASTDHYTYALSGASSGYFSVAGTSNTATLSVGKYGLPGGYLFALNVTATDTTTGVSTSAQPINVIVGGASADSVPLAQIVGSSAVSAPMFVYGLGGNDVISGTGMTGSLWIDGGLGADKLTGGSGINHYLYTNAADSTATSMDVIANFSASRDLIDLTGLGGHALSFSGALAGTSFAAYSVGYASSGGNTFVYINTTGASEALGSSNMKIELAGSVSLSSANILHV